MKRVPFSVFFLLFHFVLFAQTEAAVSWRNYVFPFEFEKIKIRFPTQPKNFIEEGVSITYALDGERVYVLAGMYPAVSKIDVWKTFEAYCESIEWEILSKTYSSWRDFYVMDIVTRFESVINEHRVIITHKNIYALVSVHNEEDQCHHHSYFIDSLRSIR